MTVFERLGAVTEAARQERQLPDYLAERIGRILAERDRFRDRPGEIADLAELVANYDTYGQTGYLGMGVNHVILERALDRLVR